MLMTAKDAKKLFNDIAKRDGEKSYVLVFYAEVDDAMSTAADELDGGEGNCVESALALYLSLCEENIPSEEEDESNDG
jgi:hypothetical protein